MLGHICIKVNCLSLVQLAAQVAPLELRVFQAQHLTHFNVQKVMQRLACATI
jgi:hypothetical protein